MRARDPIDILSRAQSALRVAASDADPIRRAHLHEVVGELYELGKEFAVRPRIVLAPADDGWWLVGPEGREQRLHYPHLGLRAAHLALAGSCPTTAEFAPDSPNADGIVRRAIRDQAAKWAARVARCPDLAAAMCRINVKAGRVQSPDVGKFVTGSPTFTSTS